MNQAETIFFLLPLTVVGTMGYARIYRERKRRQVDCWKRDMKQNLTSFFMIYMLLE